MKQFLLQLAVHSDIERTFPIIVIIYEVKRVAGSQF